ncbi:C4-dicarboxylate transport transcriptional regulatory protein DctD [Gemmata obscuriglobus]|uniref:Response regulator n=1 Tax=Gemmata obscuriglobus TaxID=114 RepID=A0A2Z3GU47_9BACT|nr:response regulator [Gemmata obscuriglobus]QEG29216.1 C4-dicarboxylate transport transcriptional regulatory protein DctD [Gemmata obscuriglobus]VTS08009.1 ---NA--- : Histidine kinase OS=Intrasporangium chromatireducens Q5-1 GN=N864_00500 PE=4 SV=1: Response_reg [Gemmata obscuriglobus UQM 2246]
MPKLLLAEENAAVRKLATRVLAHAGYQITAVANRAAALAALLRSPPDCVAAILNQGARGLTGTEVIARIRSVHPALPILLISGGLEPPLDSHTRFLGKPFIPDKLVWEVAWLLAHSAIS